MSNRKKTQDPLRRAPQHRQGRGRHREPLRTPGDLITVPGQAGVRILAAGALGSAAVMSLSGAASAATATGPVTAALTASVKPASSAAAPISGGNATVSVTNGQPSVSFNLKTPFGQTPNLTVPTVSPFQPTPLQFTLDPAGAINSDPVLRNLPAALAAQQAQQALSSFVPPTFDIMPSAPAAPSSGPSAPVPLFGLPATGSVLIPGTPSASPGPAAPIPFAGMSSGISDLLSAIPAQAAPDVGPAGNSTSPTALGLPTLSFSGRVSGALGPIGGTVGLAGDTNGNYALTLGYLVGFGGGASFAISPTPAPTTFDANLSAQASGGINGYSLTGGVGGSLTNFTGLQMFGRFGFPNGEQFTASGTVPPSVLAQIGVADSNAAAAEAGLPTIDVPVAPATPNQQVTQAFADMAAIGGGGIGGSGITVAPGGRILNFGTQTTAGLIFTIPLTRDYLNQVGQALGNAEMVLPTLPDPAPAPALTAAQRIDQGFAPFTPLANSVDPLTYQPPGGQFPIVPSQVVNSEFAQLQPSPGLLTQMVQQAEQGGQGPSGPAGAPSPDPVMLLPSSITGAPSSALDQLLFMPPPAQAFPPATAPGSGGGIGVPLKSGQADPAASGSDVTTAAGTAAGTGLSGFPPGSFQVASNGDVPLPSGNTALDQSLGLQTVQYQAPSQGQPQSGLSPQGQILQQLVPDLRTPPVTDGIYPNLIPPLTGSLPGGTTIQMGNSTFTIPYDPSKPIQEIVAPTYMGGVLLYPGETNSYPPGTQLQLGTSGTSIPGNRDTLQLPDGTYYVGLPPAPGQPDTRSQVTISTVPPAGVDVNTPGTPQTPQDNSGQGAPAQGTPDQGTPTQGGAPAQGAPGQGAPAQDSSGQGAPGQGAPGQGAPGQGAPGQGAPGQGAPGQDSSGQGGAPAQGAPAQGAPGQQGAATSTGGTDAQNSSAPAPAVVGAIDPSQTSASSLLSPTPMSQTPAPLTTPAASPQLLNPAPTIAAAASTPAPYAVAGGFGDSGGGGASG